MQADKHPSRPELSRCLIQRIASIRDPIVRSMAEVALLANAEMRARRNYAAEYRKRKAKRPGLSARQAAGHPLPEDRLPRGTFYARRVGGGPTTVLINASVSRRDIRRVARFLSLSTQLAEGRLDYESFRGRVGVWRPVVVLAPQELSSSWRFENDPEAVIASMESQRVEERDTWIDSGRSRPSSRRRSR